jgi:hypothetical protein
MTRRRVKQNFGVIHMLTSNRWAQAFCMVEEGLAVLDELTVSDVQKCHEMF